MKFLKILLFFIFLSGSVFGTETLLPIVEEKYDSIVVVSEIIGDRDWVRRRAYFIRGKNIIAERSVDEQMNWRGEGDKLILEWDDYGVCHRIITFDSLYCVETDETTAIDDKPWWQMQRRMTDLKAPEPLHK